MRSPEINFAARIVELRALHPPIDVKALVEEHATLEFVNFPVEIDGICLNLKQHNRRPHVLINEALPKLRFRFTLAHELGHIIIPWHVGSIVDETAESHEDLAFKYWELEGEANRFASELLMPESWAKELLETATDPLSATDNIASLAQVSFVAAFVRVQGLLPPGFVYCRFSNGNFDYRGRSQGTHASFPNLTGQTPDRLFPHAAGHWHRQRSDGQYHMWRFQSETPLELCDRPWREIFEEMASDIGLDPADRPKFKQRTMAVLSSANSTVRISRTLEAVSPEAVNSACIQRLHANIGWIPGMEAFVKHPKLHAFVASKVKEFFAVKPTKKSKAD